MYNKCIKRGNLIYLKPVKHYTMKPKKEKIEIRMSITGELARRLTAIKEYYQYESYTDTIRFLITSKFEDLAKEKPFIHPEKNTKP